MSIVTLDATRKAELKRAMAAIKVGLAKKAVTTGTDHVIFTKTHILSCDERVTVSYPLRTDLEFSVPADDFYKVIQNLKKETMTIIVEENVVTLKDDKAQSELVVNHDYDEVRALATLIDTSKLKWHKIPEGFITGLELCQFSAGKNITSSAGNIQIKKNKIESTDMARVSRYTMADDVEMPLIFVPAFLVSDVLSIHRAHNFTHIAFGKNGSWLHFSASGIEDDGKEGVIVSIKTGAGLDEFDISGIISVEGEEVTLPRELADILLEMKDFVDAINETELAVRITVSNKTIRVRAEKTTRSYLEREVDLEQPINTSTKRIMTNPTFFAQIMNLAAEGQSVKMYLSQNKASFRVGNFNHALCLSTE